VTIAADAQSGIRGTARKLSGIQTIDGSSFWRHRRLKTLLSGLQFPVIAELVGVAGARARPSGFCAADRQ
jgi:hypothetical protein